MNFISTQARLFNPASHAAGYVSLVLYVIVGFSLASYGFDLYAHVVHYYVYASPNQSYYKIFSIIVPRYLILSDIYTITRGIGIPTGVVAFCLTIFPLLVTYAYILRNFSENALHEPGIKLFAFLVSFFYGGGTLVVNWCVAYFITGKRIFLLGIILHPLGFIAFVIVILLKRDLKSLFLYSVLILVYAVTMLIFPHSLQPSDIYRNEISSNWRDIYVSLRYIVRAKSWEIAAIATFTVFFAVSARIRYSKAAMFGNVALLFFVVFVGYKMIGKSAVLKEFMSNNTNAIFRYAWYDFGSTNKDMTYLKLFEIREEASWIGR